MITIFIFDKTKINQFKLAGIIKDLGKDSIIVLITHGIYLYVIRILEKMLKMELHTFPWYLSFSLIMILEIITVYYMPKFIRKTFGK